MSFSLTLKTLGDRRFLIAVTIVILLVLGFLLRSVIFTEQQDKLALPPPKTVPVGGAGIAGDVLISEEAMQLAEITTAPAEIRQVQERIQASGTIETSGNQVARVSPQAPGKVVRILANVGDPVKEGQALALLESGELAQAQSQYRQARSRRQALANTLARQQELAGLQVFGSDELEDSQSRALAAERQLQEAGLSLVQGQSGVETATNQLNIAKNSVLQTQAELSVKEAHLHRAEALPQLVSLQQFERLRADARQAEASLATAKATVAQQESNVKTARAALEAARKEQPLAQREAQIRRSAQAREEKVYSGGYSRSRELLEAETSEEMARIELEAAAERVRLLGGTPGEGSQISLLSPIGGTVQEASLALGQSLDSEHVAFTVMNLQEAWAELSLAPKDVSKLKVGDPVEIVADVSLGKPLQARLSSIGAQADPVTKMIKARAKIIGASPSLKVGSFVKATIVTEVRHERLTVPAAALQDHLGRPTIYVSKNDSPGAFEVRHVSLGTEAENWREVTEGLKAGESLATHGTFYLKSEAMKSALSDGCCSVGP